MTSFATTVNTSAYTPLVGSGSIRWVEKDRINQQISKAKNSPDAVSKESEADPKRIAQSAVVDFVDFFAPFASVKNRAAIYVSPTDQNLESCSSRAYCGSIRCHPIEFSLFSDFIVSETAGISQNFAEDSTGTLLPTLAIGTARGTLLVQVDSTAQNLVHSHSAVNLSGLSFRLIPAAESKNLLPCRGWSPIPMSLGADQPMVESCLLCRVLGEDEVRGPIERHESSEAMTTYNAAPSISISSAVNNQVPNFLLIEEAPVYRTGDVLMSGWMVKWPMKSQYAGTSTKRFFLLMAAHRHSAAANAVLAYWTRPPDCLSYLDFKETMSHSLQHSQNSSNAGSYHDDDSARATIMSPNGLQDLLCRDDMIAMHSCKGQIVLDGSSSVRIMRSALLGGRYLEISTDSDTLCVECSSAEVELSWFSKLSAVMNYQRMVTVLQFPNRKLFAMKGARSNNRGTDISFRDDSLFLNRLDVASYFSSVVISPALCLNYVNSKALRFVDKSLNKRTKRIDGNKLDLSKAKSGFHMTQGIRTTISVLDVSADVLHNYVRVFGGTNDVPLAKVEKQSAPSPCVSIAETSVEGPMSLSASPSEVFINQGLQNPSSTQSIFSRGVNVGHLGQNRELVRSKAPVVSVDSGVDLDEGVSSSNVLLPSGEFSTSSHGIDCDSCKRPDVISYGPCGDLAVLTFQRHNTIQNKTDIQKNEKDAPKSDSEFYPGQYFIHMMDDSNVSYGLRVDSRYFDHPVDECILRHMTHRSVQIGTPKSSAFGGDVSVRLYVLSGKSGYIGVGYTALHSSVQTSMGGIKHLSLRPLRVELMDGLAHLNHDEEEVGTGTESFSRSYSSAPDLVKSTISSSQNNSNAVERSPAIELTQLSANLSAEQNNENPLFGRVKSFAGISEDCAARKRYEEAMAASRYAYTGLFGASAHSADADITSVVMCRSAENACQGVKCDTFPCVCCSKIETQAVSSESNLIKVHSHYDSDVIVSGDDLGVLCLWRLSTLSTLVLSIKPTFSSVPKNKKNKSIGHADPVFRPDPFVRVRSRHSLMHRVTLGAPITSISIAADSRYVAVCTVTQALLYEIVSESFIHTAIPLLKFQLISVMDDCTSKDVLFRHRFTADLISSPGRVRLWKMCTIFESDASDGRNPNYFQFSDLSISECKSSSMKALTGIRNRFIEANKSKHKDDNRAIDASIQHDAEPLLRIQEFISWLGDGFGVISAWHVHEEGLMKDRVQDSSEYVTADKWSMDDFEEYIRLRNRVKKWWRENSSRVLILHEKNRDGKSTSSVADVTAVNIAVNKTLIVPPGGACGQPTPVAHTCAPALVGDVYHHIFMTESASNDPSNPHRSIYEEPVRQYKEIIQIRTGPPSFYCYLNDKKELSMDSSNIPLNNKKSSKHIVHRNGPEGVDFASPLFAAAVTKEFRGHCLIKCVLQTVDNNAYYKFISNNTGNGTGAHTCSDFEELCTFEMLCSLVFQLYESYGDEYIDAVKIAMQAELSEELLKLLIDKPRADADCEMLRQNDTKNGFIARSESNSDNSIFKLSNYLRAYDEEGCDIYAAQCDSFSHLISGFVSRIHSVPILAIIQLDEIISCLEEFISVSETYKNDSLGDDRAAEVLYALSLLQYVTRMRQMVMVFSNAESGYFFSAMRDLFELPDTVHLCFAGFKNPDYEKIDSKLSCCTKRIMEIFVVNALVNMERTLNSDTPLSLVVAISGFDHSQSPNLIRLVHNQEHSRSRNEKDENQQFTPLTVDNLKTQEHAVMVEDAETVAKAINEPMLNAYGVIDIKMCNANKGDVMQGISPTLAVASTPAMVLTRKSVERSNNMNIGQCESAEPKPAAESNKSASEGQASVSAAAEKKKTTPAPGAQLHLISELIQRSPSWVRFVLSSRNKADQTLERSVLSNPASPILLNRKKMQ